MATASVAIDWSHPGLSHINGEIPMSSDDTLSLSDHNLLVQLVSMFLELDAHLQSGLDSIEAKLREHDARLASLEKTVEARIYDTRPIWEAVQSQISELRADVEKGFRKSDRKTTLFYEQVSELYAYQRDLEERIEKLENKS